MNPWRKNPVIYEINTRVWLGEMPGLEGRPAKLQDVSPRSWDEIARLKPDAVWLMGVWERSPLGIAISNAHTGNLADFNRALPGFTPDDNVGSPYCIRSYRVDAALGGDAGLAAARQQLASRGIRLILDFVPNHVAHDHPWTESHPGFFIRGTEEDLKSDPVTFTRVGNSIFACGKDPFYPAWQDVLQLNAFNEGLRKAAVETITGLAARCDGLRCDMAMLMINDIFEKNWAGKCGPRPSVEYWEALIPAARRVNPGFLFIAEAYWDTEWILQRQGFDYCYDKRLYDRLEAGDTEGIRRHLTADTAWQSKLVRFTENHDEPRHATVFGPDRSEAAALVAATVPGARLFHEGQPDGRKTRLPVFLRRRPAEPPEPRIRTFFNKMLQVISDPVFHDGTWELCSCSGWPDNGSYANLLAWQWRLNGQRCLVVINHAPRPAQGMVSIPGEKLEKATYTLYDPVQGHFFERAGTELSERGLFVSLGPWKYHLLLFSRR